MDDEGGEYIEEESIGTGESQNLGDWYKVDKQKPGVDSRDEVRHAENIIFICQR